MARKRKTYTREFKVEAVRQLEQSGKTQQAIEKELGLSSGTLSRWKKQLREEGADAFPGRGRRSPTAERIRQLEREKKRLEQEVAILKAFRDHVSDAETSDEARSSEADEDAST